jgi:hypothetical protein
VSLPPDPPTIPHLSGRARDDIVSAALEVVSKRSMPAIAALFEVVHRVDKRRATRTGDPQGCPTCHKKRISAPTIRVLLDEASTDDQVFTALRNVHRIRDRDYAVQLLEPWLWRGSIKLRLAVVQALGKHLRVARTIRALSLPSLVAPAPVRKAVVQLLEQAGATALVISAVRLHPGLRRHLQVRYPEHAHPAVDDDKPAERRARFKTTGEWCDEFLRLNGRQPRSRPVPAQEHVPCTTVATRRCSGGGATQAGLGGDRAGLPGGAVVGP